MSLNPTMRRPTSASRRHRSFCSRAHNHALVARRALRGGSRAADVFKNGKILGIEEFLRSAEGDLPGRAQWTTLLSEVLPRALLAELRLSSMLLGSSGGGQFLLVLPQELRDAAEEFCARAATALRERTAAAVSMVWAFT